MKPVVYETEFHHPQYILNRNLSWPIKIERRWEREHDTGFNKFPPDWTEAWAVTLTGDRVLNYLGDWEWEPRPSERSDEFIARTRFRSAEEAHVFLAQCVRESSARKE